MSSLETLQQLVHKKYGIEPSALDPQASIRAQGLDSLALVELLFEIEDHFGISIPEAHSGIDTLADLAAAVDSILSGQPSATTQQQPA